MTDYQPGCSYCPPTVRACKVGEQDEKGPGWCPSKVDDEALVEGRAKYDDPFLAKVALEAGKIEAEGYCKWTRVEEICVFCKRMGFKRVGIATCIGFIDQSNTLGQILERHGFEVISACCKSGSVPKEEIGLEDDEKIRPGTYEPMCNPISQAELLNRAGCEFNIVMALCIGHDSLFFKHSEGLATTLVAKDRVVAHNSAAALYMADSYYSKVWGPYKPDKTPKKPGAGRRKDAD